MFMPQASMSVPVVAGEHAQSDQSPNKSPGHVVEILPRCKKNTVLNYPTIGILLYVILCSNKTYCDQAVTCWNRYFR
jgi:hypothetical protein